MGWNLFDSFRARRCEKIPGEEILRGASNSDFRHANRRAVLNGWNRGKC